MSRTVPVRPFLRAVIITGAPAFFRVRRGMARRAVAVASVMIGISALPWVAVTQDVRTAKVGDPYTRDVPLSSAPLAQAPTLEPGARASIPDDPATPRPRELREAVTWSWGRLLAAAVAIVGAVLLSLPLALIYLRTTPVNELDSTMLLGIVILAATIAAMALVVEGALARALTLLAAVSAVRFRGSIGKRSDAFYCFGAIAIGLAAGSRALDIGVVMAALLSTTFLLLWKVRIDVLKRAVSPRQAHATRLQRPGADRAMAASDNAPISTPVVTSDAGHPRILTLETPPSARLGYLVIETEHPERTRLLVETFLERETKRWRLDGSNGNGNGTGRGHTKPNGRATLLYLIRFKKRSRPETILERLRAVGQPTDFTARLETDASVPDPAA